MIVPRVSASACASFVLVLLSTLLAAPILAHGLWALTQQQGRESLGASVSDPWLLLRTVGVAGGIGLGAVLLAWPAAWWVRASDSKIRLLLLLPLLVPSYFVSSSYGLLRAPGTLLGDVVAQSTVEVTRLVVTTQAIGGLVLWSWPLAMVVLMIAIASVPEGQLEALRLSTGSVVTQFKYKTRLLWRGVMVAWFIVAMLMAGSAVPLHVAGFPTYALEIWRTLDEHPGTVAAWGMSVPMLVGALLAGSVLILGLGDRGTKIRLNADAHESKSNRVLVWLIWSLSILVPVAALLYSFTSWSSIPAVFQASGDAWRTSVQTATLVVIFSVGLGALASMGLARGWRTQGGIAVRASLVLFVMLAFVPGVLVGAALLELATDYPVLRWMAETRWGVVVSHLARFGSLPILAAVMFCAWEARELTMLRQMERDTAGVWIRTSFSRQLPALCAASIVAGVFSLHEIESSVVLMQPGTSNLPRHLLNLLHYNRVQELIASLLMLLGLGLIVVPVIGWAFWKSFVSLRHQSTVALLACVCLLGVVSCSQRSTELSGNLPGLEILGEPGRSPGQFIKPRCIDSDGSSLWVIDRSGRVQRLDTNGDSILEWELPSHDRGFPTGVTAGKDGLLYIADTHEHRILICRVAGDTLEVVRMIGQYGQGDSEFVYPTDVAIATETDGITPRLFFVSEYGGNDRISVFNRDWKFLSSFGREGTSSSPDDIAFCRPQSLLFNDLSKEILVADACNHRIGRFTEQGDLIEWVGSHAGSEPGEFRYPYGLTLVPDGSVLVTEFGNNRIQHIQWAGGGSIATYGRPGRDESGLTEPWSSAILGQRVYVLDTGKHRLVSFVLPQLSGNATK